jgi:ectoine hydroxylase-related dioxygenase (phytanoyl-CoA dioxygenase family)
MKAGIVHVQPPTEILDAMLTIRIHLDDCDENNGALRVIPKSHLHGRLNSSSIQNHKSAIPEQICCVPKGGALLMKPLLLHASSSAINPSHRRVIHIEYCAAELPCGLRWHEKS